MPAKNKRAVTGGQQVQKPEIIILCLPLIGLGLLLAVVFLNNNPVSGKPAVVAAAPTPAPTVSLTPLASLTTSSPASPTPTLATFATTLAAASIPAASVTTGTATGPTTVLSTSAATPGDMGANRTVKGDALARNGTRLTGTEDGLKFDMLVSPGHIGNNNYLLLLSENGNRAVTDASLVRLSVTSLDMDMGVATLDLQPAGADQPGLYTGIDNKLQMLSMVGKFNLAVLVRRPGYSDVTTSFQLSVKGS